MESEPLSRQVVMTAKTIKALFEDALADEGAVPGLVGVLEALRPRPGALASVGLFRPAHPVRHEVGPWCQKTTAGQRGPVRPPLPLPAGGWPSGRRRRS